MSTPPSRTPPRRPVPVHAAIGTGLALVLEQAEAERDRALARTLDADAAVSRARAQDAQLLAYRQDYHRRAPALAAAGAGIEMVRCHQGFLVRLDQAIEQHQVQCRQLEQRAATEREALTAQELRVAAVAKLIERRLGEHTRRDQRRERRHADELAQRMALARRHRPMDPENR